MRKILIALIFVFSCQHTFGQTYTYTATSHYVPYFTSSSSPHQTFVRITWYTCRSRPNISVMARDDLGMDYGPIEIIWRHGPHGCGQIVVFNSNDLENGNIDKGVFPGVGKGIGDWQLFVKSTDPVSVNTYTRTLGRNALMTMHDIVPFFAERNAYFVAMFNPGRHRSRQSYLRLINPNDISVGVRVLGQDDTLVGSYVYGPSIPMNPHEALMVSAADLEEGRPDWIDARFGHDDGALGVPDGKWRLYLQARSLSDNESKPLIVMHLVKTADGDLFNLSTVPVLSPEALGFTPDIRIPDFN